MPVDDRMRAQHQLILDNHGGTAAHPTPDQWGDVDNIEYLYREYAILVRQPDADRVVDALGEILGQVRVAHELGTTGPVLDRVFRQARGVDGWARRRLRESLREQRWCVRCDRDRTRVAPPEP